MSAQSPHDPVPDEEIASMKREAIMALRWRVEHHGMHWREALNEVLDLYPLGLCQIADIEAGAERRYGASVKGASDGR